MLDFSTLAKDFLEEKIASGELKILPKEKNPRLFDPSIEDKIKVKQGICLTCGHKMKLSRKGAYFCSRKRTNCHTYIPSKNLTK